MKRSLFVLIFLSGLFLAACGEEKNGTSKNASKVQVLAKQTEWNDYKETLEGDYQMFYKTTGFSFDTDSELFVEVRGGDLSTASVVTGELTMDDFYEHALDIIADDDCSLEISYYEERPAVIKRYSATCHSETEGIEVTGFHEGHPVNF